MSSPMLLFSQIQSDGHMSWNGGWWILMAIGMILFWGSAEEYRQRKSILAGEFTAPSRAESRTALRWSRQAARARRRPASGAGSTIVWALGGFAIPFRLHANSLAYTLGGIALASFVGLVVTGIYLAQFYDPTPARAHASVTLEVVGIVAGFLLLLGGAFWLWRGPKTASSS